jgi:hypothetical protein
MRTRTMRAPVPRESRAARAAAARPAAGRERRRMPILRPDVRAIEHGLITNLPGDNSGSHRAGTSAIVQTPPGPVPAGKRPAQHHPDPPGPMSKSHDMQEFLGSHPQSLSLGIRDLQVNILGAVGTSRCTASYRYPVRVFEQEVIFGAWGSQEGEPVAEESAEVWTGLYGHLSRSLACQGSLGPLQTRVLADLGAGGPGFKSRHPDQFMQVRALLILVKVIRAGTEGSHPPLRRASQLA